jgi:hypothetical protein
MTNDESNIFYEIIKGESAGFYINRYKIKEQIAKIEEQINETK